MPLGLAVTTMVEGAVPVTTSSVNQGTSLLADQSMEPDPALPMVSIAVWGAAAFVGKVHPNCVGPTVSVGSSRLRSSSTTTVILVLADSPTLFVAVNVMACVPTNRSSADQ